MNPVIRYSANGRRARQSGVVLFIALIAMLILTLAGVSLVRVVDSSMTLAGNLAFRQSANAAADQGVNAAVAWLLQQSRSDLEQSIPASGYLAVLPPEPSNWADPVNWPAGNTVTLAGPNGNTVSYRIFRLCIAAGAVNLPGQSCNLGLAPAGVGTSGGNSKSSGATQFQGSVELYYRVVVRVVGPRNAASYVQVMVSRGA